MDKGRIESFSDGVIAVAITLLALNLPVPDPASRHSLAHNLGKHWPDFAAFAVSFLTIGIIWINHHALLRRLERVDHSVLGLNLMLLLSICLLPFSTALMARYLTQGRGQHLAAAIYGASFLLMSLAFFAIQRHVLQRRVHLLHDDMTPALRRLVLRRNAVGLLPYAIATAAGALSPYVTLVMTGAVAAYYAAPRTTEDYKSRQ
jgi:uncharacterized membrane protein